MEAFVDIVWGVILTADCFGIDFPTMMVYTFYVDVDIFEVTPPVELYMVRITLMGALKALLK